MIPEPGFYERIDLEAAQDVLIGLADEDELGNQFVRADLDAVRSIIEAALVGVQPATVELKALKRCRHGHSGAHAYIGADAGNACPGPEPDSKQQRVVTEWKPVGEEETP